MSIFRIFLGAVVIGAIFPMTACPSSQGIAAESNLENTSPQSVEYNVRYRSFIYELKEEAASNGISAGTISILDGIIPITEIILFDRKQPEFTLTFKAYASHILTPKKISTGRKQLYENRHILADIEGHFGVQARFIVALWGIETNFGRQMGKYQIVPALVTLAFDGRRPSFFRGELLSVLKILDEVQVPPEDLKGSWAGAMGQCQFMPSTFLKFAVDWDGDGRRDIWGNRGDALASAANYLAESGWKPHETWGLAVELPANFDSNMLGLEMRKSVAEWTHLGIKAARGGRMPDKGLTGSIIRAGKDAGPVFLVFDNFLVLMKWNRSTFFALAASQLADRIGAR